MEDSNSRSCGVSFISVNTAIIVKRDLITLLLDHTTSGSSTWVHTPKDSCIMLQCDEYEYGNDHIRYDLIQENESLLLQCFKL